MNKKVDDFLIDFILLWAWVIVFFALVIVGTTFVPSRQCTRALEMVCNIS